MADTPTTTVEFWFDPTCPWAWMTSRWIGEVARQRPELELAWNPMSLYLLNKDREDVDPEYMASHGAAHRRGYDFQRVSAGLIAEGHGPERVKAFYDALGERIHPGGRTDDAILPEAAAEAGVPAELLERAAAGEFGEALQASHDAALERVGDDVGTPIIAVNGVAFFGPVISPAPKGEEALRLFDGIVMAASYEGFFELKRSRTRGPVF